MLSSNLQQSRLIGNKSNRENASGYIDQRKFSTNSLHYSTIRVGTESSPQSQTLIPSTFHNSLTESRISQNSVFTQIKATTNGITSNYLELIEKIKKQTNEEKNNLVLVKVNDGQNKQTGTLEKCTTLPSFLSLSTNNNSKQNVGYEQYLTAAAAAETKGEFGILKESNRITQVQKPQGNQNITESDKKNIQKIGFGFTPIIKENEIIGKVKEIRLSPHKHSYTDLNLRRFEFESPSNPRKDEYRDHNQLAANKLQTPTFNQSRKLNEKMYPKLYDELYASSFQYPEQEDPVIEIQQKIEEEEEEQPFQSQKNNFISFSSDLNIQKEQLVNGNYLIQDPSKAKFFGNYFTKRNQQNENNASIISGQENYIPSSEEIKNIASQKILFMPLTKQVTQTPQPQLIHNLLSENKNSVNQVQGSQSVSSLNSHNLLSKPISHQSILNFKDSQNSYQQQQQPLKTNSNLFSENISPTYSKLDKDLKSYLPYYSTTTLSSSSTNTQQLNLQNVNIQQYLKQNNIPDYKPLTSQQNNLSQSAMSQSTSHFVMTRSDISVSPCNQTTNDLYNQKSYLITSPDFEQTRYRTSGNEKRDLQPSTYSYIKI